MLVAICTKNPKKIQATKEAFSFYHKDSNFVTFDMDSYQQVYDQPMSREETIESAHNRIKIVENAIEADFYVSLEGGVGEDEYGAFLTGFVIIKHKNGKKSVSGGYRMPIPFPIMERLKKEKTIELGDIIDELAGIKNSKQKDGAVGLFTNGFISRKESFKEMVALALIPFTSNHYKEIERKNKKEHKE